MVAMLLLALPSAAYVLPFAVHRAPAASVAASRSAAVRLQVAPPGAPGDVQIVSEETYGLMLSTLLTTNNSLPEQISANYAMVDYAFLQKLEEAIAEKGEHEAKLIEIKAAVNEEMAKRMQAAAESLREILQSPTAVIMEGKIAGYARQGRIDDALLQLLEANLQQAQAAGEAGKQAAAVMQKLQERVKVEVDAKLSPTAALLRRLMRMDDPIAREGLLKEKMTPKKVSKIVLTDSQGNDQKPDENEGKPDVDPRELAQAITEIKSRFGNVDESYDTGFVKKLEAIADEAEKVALDLAGGKELSAQQQQDMMWDRGTISVWDLEAVEEEAHQDGKLAMWEQEAQDMFARQENADRSNAIQQDLLQ